ncbi:MAG: hypothetical protein GF346_03480 [Candidatus Eisenbacteria bacterium]|nr:hypothetical protein [Candidatus Latescibacterota bacterium]MBD3301484.1 hypothetical protein [Candidatus Eisenbacteria bacterium]
MGVARPAASLPQHPARWAVDPGRSGRAPALCAAARFHHSRGRGAGREDRRPADRDGHRGLGSRLQRGDPGPDLASLCEPFFFSPTPPLGEGQSPWLPGLDGEDDPPAPAKEQCASVGGFFLHAGQSVRVQDREALERLLRYGLRAPFAQERLSRRGDGKVVYRLRRLWPNPQGTIHLVCDPLDFLRRLAALVSPR